MKRSSIVSSKHAHGAATKGGGEDVDNSRPRDPHPGLAVDDGSSTQGEVRTPPSDGLAADVENFSHENVRYENNSKRSEARQVLAGREAGNPPPEGERIEAVRAGEAAAVARNSTVSSGQPPKVGG